MAEWLIAPTTSVAARNSAMLGLNAAPQQLETAVLPGFTSESVDEFSTKLRDLLDLRYPFAEKADDPVLAQVSIENPKPQKYEDMPETVGAEEYDKYLNAVFNKEQGFVETVKEYEAKHGGDPDGDGPNFKAIAADVETTRRAFRDVDSEAEPAKSQAIYAQLASKQKAFAFLKVKHVGKELEKYSGGAAPLDPGTGPAKPVIKSDRRRIVFHKAEESFSRDILASLEPQRHQRPRRHLRRTS